MGGSSSKPIEAPTFTPDLSKATLSVEEVQRQLAEASSKAAEAAQVAAQEASYSAWGTAKWLIYGLLTIIVLGGIAFGVWYILYATGVTNKNPGDPSGYSQAGPATTLSILTATQSGIDVAPVLRGMIKTDSIYLSPVLSAGIMSASAGTITGLKAGDKLTIQYKFSDEDVVRNVVYDDDVVPIDISTAQRPDTGGNPMPQATRKPTSSGGKMGATAPTGQSFFGSMYNSLFGSSGSSGDQLPYAKDASAEAVVPAGNAPSAGNSYGMQWWMFVNDWNYKFGQDKHVISRHDSTNYSIMNPEVSLHPTDNSLKISISVFPDSSGGSSKAQPAPAGHSSATDDVFICEVPNIPLQTWFSVSMSVFGRNLDVYINGKLVKSCVLTGVPKPAVGDISLNKNGGFSGYLCGFYHYTRMLQPNDAQAFYSAGTSCSSVGKGKQGNASQQGMFKFGLFDASGKEVSQYVL